MRTLLKGLAVFTIALVFLLSGGITATAVTSPPVNPALTSTITLAQDDEDDGDESEEEDDDGDEDDDDNTGLIIGGGVSLGILYVIWRVVRRRAARKGWEVLDERRRRQQGHDPDDPYNQGHQPPYQP
ncbi:MAG TPA: hypothetical protein VFT59_00615 [Candidatus Saccharimonadales bacterium]|nr:hypothetical protein [Candidatus Saccharimonadales bacterium]